MQIESYLFFGGNCEEALAFYKRCLGGEIVKLMRFEGSPMDNAELPSEWKQKVMHSTFESQGARFMASDSMPGQPKPNYSGFAMSLYVPGDLATARRPSRHCPKAARSRCRSHRRSGAGTSAC